MTGTVRNVFTIEEDPIADEANRFIVRKWELDSKSRDCLDLGEVGRAGTVEYARTLVPGDGVAPLPVFAQEHIKVLETWV